MVNEFVVLWVRSYSLMAMGMMMVVTRMVVFGSFGSTRVDELWSTSTISTFAIKHTLFIFYSLCLSSTLRIYPYKP